MDTGVKISASAHTILIGLAMFGGPLFDAEADETLKITQVSLVSADAFAARNASEQPAQPTEEIQPSKPEIEEPVIPEPEETPEEPEEQPEEPIGNNPTEELGVTSETPQAGELKPEEPQEAAPKQADTISSEVNESTDADLKPNEVETAEAVEKPTEEPTKADEPEEASTQKDTTTEIVTEAEDKFSDLAPAKSARPRGRPKNLELAVEEPKPEEPEEPKEVVEDTNDQVAEDIAAAIAAAAAEEAAAQEASASPSERTGPPLSGSEMDGLVFSIQQCWNVPVGLKNDGDNVVTMRIKLSKDGRLEEEPTRISPLSGSAVGILQAFESARRALIRCQPYNLPVEKYETWREIEIVFNPGEMVLR